jgi:hypothetical protein
MCEKCVELDKKIARYWGLSEGIDDRAIKDRLASLVAELQAQKTVLHPEGSDPLAAALAARDSFAQA